LFVYDGILMEAIHQFKYAGRTMLARVFGPLMADSTELFSTLSEKPLIMPVPLHPRRLRERGFNQSLLLARHISMVRGAELDFMTLKRVKYTAPQTSLGQKERPANVRKAFALDKAGTVSGRSVLLVDDVATTGSTLNECARVLKKGGSKEIFGLVLARTAHF
jgi:ComF family protein